MRRLPISKDFEDSRVFNECMLMMLSMVFELFREKCHFKKRYLVFNFLELMYRDQRFPTCFPLISKVFIIWGENKYFLLNCSGLFVLKSCIFTPTKLAVAQLRLPPQRREGLSRQENLRQQPPQSRGPFEDGLQSPRSTTGRRRGRREH